MCYEEYERLKYLQKGRFVDFRDKLKIKMARNLLFIFMSVYHYYYYLLQVLLSKLEIIHHRPKILETSYAMYDCTCVMN